MTDDRYDGVFTVTEKSSATTFRYVHPVHSDLPASGGGTAAITAGSPDRGPAFAQGWDDWGPFYGQTILAQIGVDSSTVEVPGSNSNASADRRIGKKAHYVAIYSSADFWVDNRQAMFLDQLERFRRGVADEPWNPDAIDQDPVLVERGFDDYWHNWMYDYPKAYVIPFGAGQRSAIRGQPSRPVPARQRDLGHPRHGRLHVERRHLPSGFLRDLAEPGPARARA